MTGAEVSPARIRETGVDLSVEIIRNLMTRYDVDREDLARRMFVSSDELDALLSEKIRFKRLHMAGLERATVSLALEHRDASVVAQPFRWQMLRFAMLVLQDQRPGSTDQEATSHASAG